MLQAEWEVGVPKPNLPAGAIQLSVDHGQDSMNYSTSARLLHTVAHVLHIWTCQLRSHVLAAAQPNSLPLQLHGTLTARSLTSL